MTWNMAKKTEKCGKMRNAPCRTGIWVETVKTWKMRNVNCRTWIIVRILKYEESEKLTIQDLEYGKKNSEKVGK